MELRRYLFVVIGLAALFGFFHIVRAGVIFFQQDGSILSSIWGRNSSTVGQRIAQEYIAPSNITIKTVQHEISRSGTLAGTITLTVWKGGTKPEDGIAIASTTLDANQVSSIATCSGETAWFDFVLPTRVSLEQGKKYFFTWTRSVLESSNGFQSCQYGLRGDWVYLPVEGGWKNDTGGWSIRLEAPDIITPVVIVPGIMGTRLNRVSDGVEVWPSSTQMAISPSDSYLDELKLSSDGRQIGGNEMNPTTIIDKESPLGFNRIIYKNLIDDFIGHGYATGTTLFTTPYDWRLNIESSTQKLDTIIQQAIAHSPGGTIDVIAHSMGGLLAKQYLSATSTNFLDKLIFAGVPQLGAPKALKILNYGDDVGTKFFGLGLNQNKAKDISQNMPSVYELLPSRNYINNNGGYLRDLRSGEQVLNYEQTKSFLSASGRNSYLLNQADTFHQNLDTQQVNVPQVYNMVGCRKSDTIGSLRIYNGGKYKLDFVTGDGTVPAGSATDNSPNVSNYFVLYDQTFADHTGLVRDSAPLQLIDNIINNLPDSLPAGISTSTTDCNFLPVPNETTVAFSAYGLTDLHVYDSLNRHTGATSTGDIEFAIPQSEFERLDNNQFIFVPSGNTYHVEIKPSSVGNFDLEIRTYNNTTPVSTVTYLGVPFTNTSSTAKLDFSSLQQIQQQSFQIQSSPDLMLDSDGDGTFETTIPPTAVLDATSSVDIVPPLVIMPNIPQSVPYGTTLTFTFSVGDDLSGVASSQATLDGVIIENGTAVTMYKFGDHVFEVKAVDNAGNPIVKDLYFNVYREKTKTSPNEPRPKTKPTPIE